MRFIPIGHHDMSTLQGATHVVVPAVGVGNVGQLALDLLIASTQAPRVGRLDDPRLLPCVGALAYTHAPGPALSLEVFRAPGGGAVFLQQRAPAAPGTQRAFAQALASWAKEAGVAQVRWRGNGFMPLTESAANPPALTFCAISPPSGLPCAPSPPRPRQVVVLGSLDAATRVDAQLAGPQLRCWAPGTSGGGEELAAACAGAGLAALEPAWFEGGKPLGERLLPPWPLLRACSEGGVPAAAALTFATEGDNQPEAYALAAAGAAVLGLRLGAGEGCQPWVQPPAWRHLDGGDRAYY